VLREALRRWRSREPIGVILLYHRVTRLEHDRWSIAVTPEHFAEHLEVLRHRSTIVSLSQLDGALREPRARGPFVVVTFDDGYADNLHEALPLLQRYDVPATMFVATDAVVTGREFWWDDLERAVGADNYDHTWRELRDCDASTRAVALDAARPGGRTSLAPRSTHRPLTRDELACLARDALIEIGGHTTSHSRLAALTLGDQRREIEEGRETLESIIGRRVESFAYPFGRPGDYTAETMRLVRDAGFLRACTNQAGHVDPSTDRFVLPRVYVRDGDGDAFAAALRANGVEI